MITLLFTRHLPDINVTLEAMLQPKATSLPGHIQAVYVQNIAKLYAKLLANQEEVSSNNRTCMCNQLQLATSSHEQNTKILPVKAPLKNDDLL